MSDNIVFKTVTFGGFDKKSVLDYICEQDQKHQEELQRLEGQLQDAVQQNQKYEEYSAEQDQKLATLAQRVEELEASLAQKEGDVTRLERELSQKDREARIQLEHNRLLQQRCEEAAQSAQQNAVQQEDSAAKEVGDIIIKANRAAENILSEAKAKAQAVEKSAAVFVGDLSERSQALAGTVAQLRAQMEESCRQMQQLEERMKTLQESCDKEAEATLKQREAFFRSAEEIVAE